MANKERAIKKAYEMYPYGPDPINAKFQEPIKRDLRKGFIQGYQQGEKDTINEVEIWLRANLYHLSCWNADEFCVSLRTHFGIK